ncbi:MAG: glycosyltransferase [Muribaculaceae bacterium]|nr:glycosyltransferase [Muribaculaceae bacterium]
MEDKGVIAKIKPVVGEFVRRCTKFVTLRTKLIKCRLWAQEPSNIFDIPIIINNYNQYDFLLRLIASLEKRGYRNIHILDNASTYPPLMEYYKHTPYKVYHLGANLGYTAFWLSGIYKQFLNQYFVYTDPDLEISEECPDDFMQRFYDLLQRHRLSSKVGFGLRIDDLPDHYPHKEKVINWESVFWEEEVEPGVYLAPIDTTFALYRPFTKNTRDKLDNILRTGFPYTMRHLPWYSNPDNQTENEAYYTKSTQSETHWGGKIDKNVRTAVDKKR